MNPLTSAAEGRVGIGQAAEGLCLHASLQQKVRTRRLRKLRKHHLDRVHLLTVERILASLRALTHRGRCLRADVALTMERQVRAVLGEQDMASSLGPARRAQLGARSRRLRDRFAGPADELLAHVWITTGAE